MAAREMREKQNSAAVDSRTSRALERDPRSYASIEALLSKEEDWEHFHHDEIDCLHEAAERMFGQTAD